MFENTFYIISNGIKYKDCWKNISINMSMDNICNSIEVSTIDFFVNNPKLWNVKKGSLYQAFVNEEIISNGYIDQINSSYSADGHEFNFSGRDKTCDLVDCSYYENNYEFKNQTLENIIFALCSPFGILIESDASIENLMQTIIITFTVDFGRTVAEQIVELCTDNGILPISKGDGKLFLTQGTLSDISSDILTEANVLDANMIDSDIDRFSEYITITESKSEKITSTDAEWISYIKNNKPIRGSFSDTNIKRKRSCVIITDVATNIKGCENRSQYEANIKAAKGLTINYTLEGWTEVKNKKVWKPNTLVLVNDKNFSINETMLINSVSLNFDDSSGYTSNLELIRKDCYSLNKTAIQLQKSGFSL